MNEIQKDSRTHSSPPLLRWIFPLAAFVLLVVLIMPKITLMAQDATAEATETMSASTTDIVAAANAFLGSLDDTQKAAVMFAYDDETQRNNWSNFPTGIFSRAGLAYGSLTADQQTAVMALLQAALSDEGYQKVINIMTADEILAQTENNQSMFGYGQYYVSILGIPSETDPWILQWGGHHLALNITFSGSNEVLTPSHTGCQPCTYILNDQEVNVLGDEYSKAFALVNSLDADQQAQAVLDYQVTNLVLGPGEEERVLEPEGIPGSALTEDQQAMLLDDISEWVNISNDDAAAKRMAEIKSHIADTYFAWSGDISETTVAYFRITGPTLLIEFAPQNMGGGQGGPGGGTPPAGGQGGGQGGTPPTGGGGFGGNQSTNPTAANDFTLDLGTFEIIQDAGALYHVHTIYRDPTNAYGSATTAQ